MADINVEIAASLGRFEREMAKVESRLTKLANSVEKKASSQLGRVDASAAQTAANLNRMVQSADKAGAAAGKFGGSLQQRLAPFIIGQPLVSFSCSSARRNRFYRRRGSV